MTVKVGPFQRIVGFHWPDTSPPPPPVEILGIPGLNVYQETDIPWTPYEGQCGLVVRVGYGESLPVWVNKYQGDDLSSLHYIQPHDRCYAQGGNINGGADFFVSFGFPADFSPYVFEEKIGPGPRVRTYAGTTISMEVWKELLTDPVEWVSLGISSVDLGGLSLPSTLSGPTYHPVGFIQIDGEWVLQVSA